jgi:large subunit ribosomal protein L18
MKAKNRSEKHRKHAARRVRTQRAIGGSSRTQLTVFRSTKHIYAQLVDPDTGQTITTVSSLSKDVVPDGIQGKMEAAKLVGKTIANVAREKQIEEVVFNRNGFLYHGRVKALADAAREAGLRF